MEKNTPILNRISKKVERILLKKWGKLIFWIVLTLSAYFVASYLTRLIVRLALIIPFWDNQDGYQFALRDTITTSISSLLLFAIMLAIIYFVPKKIFKQDVTVQDFALNKHMTWSDLGLSVIGLIVAMIMAGILMNVLSSVIPGFDSTQQQRLAFSYSSITQQWHLVVVFVMLVVVGPIMEELIFRGILYSQLRKIHPIIAIFVVSILFGIVHLQWNVGITVFVMSLVMCSIREYLTDTIWAGILLHGLKNGAAYYILYISPIILFLSNN